MRRFVERMLNFLRPRRAEREMKREIEAHLDVVASEFESRGMASGGARRAARRALGGVEQTKEGHRDARSFPFLESLIRDLRYATRTLAGSPGFSLAVIGSLSLGIAAVVAAFAFINAFVFRPYPGVEDPERLVNVIVGTDIGSMVTSNRTAMAQYPANYARLTEGLRTIDGLGSRLSGDVAATLPEARSLRAGFVSANYFDVLGARSRIGRTFVPGEDRPGAPAIAVIGHALWVGAFASDPEVVGRTIGIGNERVEIVGVTHPDFAGADHNIARPGFEIWLPIGLADRMVLEGRLRRSGPRICFQSSISAG